MDGTTDFKAVLVPIHWAGTSKNGVWTCGACRHPGDCACEGRCKRARDEDFRCGELDRA